MDYTHPPVAYLVRVPSGPDQASLTRQVDAVSQFLGYERIGPVIASTGAAAVETALAIFAACNSSQNGIELEERLEHTIGSYLDREPGNPAVLVCEPEAIRAALQRIQPGAKACASSDIVAPGGIVSVHRSEDKLVAVARTMILDFGFADYVEMVRAGA